jgi:poly(3-hydroxybutyrate) depolymerase
MANVNQKKQLARLLTKLGGVRDFDSSLVETVLSELERLEDKIPKGIDLSPLYKEISNMAERVSTIARSVVSLSEIISRNNGLESSEKKKIEKEIKNNKKEYENIFKDIRKDIEYIRSNYTKLLSHRGGGSMPRQLSLNGTVIATRYSDLNFITAGGLTIEAQNNDTTKQTDVTITGGSGGNDWVQPLVLGVIDGSNTTFYLPSVPIIPTLSLFFNGQVQLLGTDFTLTGQVIEFNYPPSPLDPPSESKIWAKYIPDTTVDTELLNLVEPITGAAFQFYAPKEYTTDRALVTTCHGTAETYIQQMGHDVSDLNEFGTEGDWTVLAEQYNFAVVSVNYLFDGNGNTGGHATMCYEQEAITAFRAVLTLLQNSGWTPSDRLLNYITGWSSGASLAADCAFFYPEIWSQCVQRHSAAPSSAGATIPDTVDNFNFNQKVRNNQMSPAVPIGSGTCTVGATIDSFNWQTSTQAKTVQMLVINGNLDDNASPVGGKYWNQQEMINQTMETKGYTTNYSSPSSTSGIISKVYTGASNLYTSTCTLNNSGGPSAIGTENYPHACHCQDKELACQYFFVSKEQFLN